MLHVSFVRYAVKISFFVVLSFIICCNLVLSSNNHHPSSPKLGLANISDAVCLFNSKARIIKRNMGNTPIYYLVFPSQEGQQNPKEKVRKYVLSQLDATLYRGIQDPYEVRVDFEEGNQKIAKLLIVPRVLLVVNPYKALTKNRQCGKILLSFVRNSDVYMPGDLLLPVLKYTLGKLDMLAVDIIYRKNHTRGVCYEKLVQTIYPLFRALQLSEGCKDVNKSICFAQWLTMLCPSSVYMILENSIISFDEKGSLVHGQTSGENHSTPEGDEEQGLNKEKNVLLKYPFDYLFGGAACIFPYCLSRQPELFLWFMMLEKYEVGRKALADRLVLEMKGRDFGVYSRCPGSALMCPWMERNRFFFVGCLWNLLLPVLSSCPQKNPVFWLCVYLMPTQYTTDFNQSKEKEVVRCVASKDFEQALSSCCFSRKEEISLIEAACKWLFRAKEHSDLRKLCKSKEGKNIAFLYGLLPKEVQSRVVDCWVEKIKNSQKTIITQMRLFNTTGLNKKERKMLQDLCKALGNHWGRSLSEIVLEIARYLF